MNANILCIKPEYVIHPGYIDCWYTNRDATIVLEIFDPVSISVHKKKYRINGGEIVALSLKHAYVKLINESRGTPCRLRGLVFRSNLDNDLIGISLAESCPNIQKYMQLLYEQALNQPLQNAARHAAESIFDFLEKLKSINGQAAITDEMRGSRALDSRLIKINRHIRKNYSNPDLSLTGLSELLNVNPTYLSNCYSKVFNISPIYHLNMIRLQNSLELLQDPDLKIQEVARRVGYSTAAQFSSIFKRYYDISPSEFRSKPMKKLTKEVFL